MSQAATLPPETVPEASPVDDRFYEIVRGEKVEKPPMGALEAWLAGVLDQQLGAYARANGLGRVVPESLFRINISGDPQRRPDVAFVSYERWPRDRKITSDNAWDVVPDLAIEVISRTNTAGEVIDKIFEYFEAGVRRVWVVYPKRRQVYVYESAAKNRILILGDELDGEDILPGFRLSLAELFEDGA